MKKSILIACLGLVSLGLQAQSISLAGEWNVELGKSGSAFAKSKRASQGEVKRAILPGTIDTNHLGFAPKDTMETTHLTRLYAYKGAARYSRTINIPKDWKKKPVELFLERTRPTWVYVDGELVDSCNFISTPQRYLLPKKVKPGKHFLEIVVDNGRGVPDQVYGSSHAYTEDTQTNWNGIIGRIELQLASSIEMQAGAIPSRSVASSTALQMPDFAKDFHIKGAHFYANGPPWQARCGCMVADGTCGNGRGRLDEVSRNLQGVWNQSCALSFLVPTGGGFRGCGQSGNLSPAGTSFLGVF